MSVSGKRLGFIVRSPSFDGLSGRDQLDLVLSAALPGHPVDLLFTGEGIQHLLPGKGHEAAGLAATWKGWKTLPELTDVRAWVYREDFDRLQSLAATPLIEVSPASADEINAALDECSRIMVI